MDFKSIVIIVFIFAWCIAAVLLRLYLSTPAKPNETLVIPAGTQYASETCVLTDETATEYHNVLSTQSYFLFYFRYMQLKLPFSLAGWEAYKRSRPISVSVYNFGIVRFGFLWFFTYGLFLFPVCGVIDLLLKKRQLIKLTASTSNVPGSDIILTVRKVGAIGSDEKGLDAALAHS